jgi:curved DNA-binding protein
VEFKDYYAVLGVKPETPVEEIKKSYRKLARQYHPDVSKLPDAEKHFKEINEAWEVLQDPQKKAHYDQLRAGGWQSQAQAQGYGQDQRQRSASGGQSDFGDGDRDFSDFFNAIFGGTHGGFGEFAGEGINPTAGHRRSHRSKRGRDYHTKINVPLSVLYQGGVQQLNLAIPQMAPGNKEEIKLNVNIPKGITDGSQIRLKGQGGQGTQDAPKGDLYIEVHASPHSHFSLHGKDVHLKLPVTPWEAALGATLAVPTLGGNVNLKIPANAHNGQKLRLKNRGLPGTPPGDQYVILEIALPSADNEKAKSLYEEMAKVLPFNPREKLGV